LPTFCPEYSFRVKNRVAKRKNTATNAIPQYDIKKNKKKNLKLWKLFPLTVQLQNSFSLVGSDKDRDISKRRQEFYKILFHLIQ